MWEKSSVLVFECGQSCQPNQSQQALLLISMTVMSVTVSGVCSEPIKSQ